MRTTVIKIGGTLVADAAAVDTLWSAVAQLRKDRGVVLVHGGGPRATEVARRLGHEPRVVHGRRVTSDVDLEIVQWTMRGELNVQLVAGAAKRGLRAVGISGADGRTLQVHKRPPWQIDDEMVDFGWVGDVQQVDASLVKLLLDRGYVPVVAPMGIDDEGRLFNVNADTVSHAIASALGAEEYLLVTDSGGVRRDASDAASHMAACTRDQFESGQKEGWIADGMLVKLKVAFDALGAGVPEVYVVSPEGILNRERGTRVVDA